MTTTPEKRAPVKRAAKKQAARVETVPPDDEIIAAILAHREAREHYRAALDVMTAERIVLADVLRRAGVTGFTAL